MIQRDIEVLFFNAVSRITQNEKEGISFNECYKDIW